MTTSDDRPIAVGISRRTGSPEALRWAVAEAGLRGTSVHAVTAWRPPRQPTAPAGRPPGVTRDVGAALTAEEARMAERIESVLGSSLARAGVTYALRTGSAATVLLQASREAQLLVLDSPRSGDLSIVQKGVIAPSVIYRALCPVVVMPPANV